MKDKLGREIKVGSYVVYPHERSSSAADLRVGKVLRFKETKNWRDEVSVKIMVRGVYDSTNPELCQKDGALQFPERMIVVDLLPSKYLTLLENL